MGRTLLVLTLIALTACTADSRLPETPSSPAATAAPGSSDEVGAASSPPPGSGMTCWTADASSQVGPITLSDVTDETGLVEPLTGMHGHTAIWTDVDGDNLGDLYVGTFADREEEVYQVRGAEGASPDRLLRSGGSEFTVDGSLPDVFSRSSGGVTVDLDNDGDLDLVVSRNTEEPIPGQASSQILENVDGSLRVVEDSGLPEDLGGRSVGVLDFDGDDRLDLFIAEDRFAGETSVLFRNDGDLHFSDVNAEAGIPEGVHGLGVATADFDGDGLADIFVSGSNRLFMSDGPGSFVEADSTVFAWELYGDEDDVAGASVGDVNRDGLLDLVLGQHFNSTLEFGETVSVRLYLNEGDGQFRDVTEEAGLTPLPTKAPHVELNDFDNDGWPEILASASAAGGPAIFVHQGLSGEVPKFTTPEGLGQPQYWVSAPTADYDHDGRLDVFLLEWEPSLPSLMLRNETETGNWLEISVGASDGFGIGWRVEVRDGDTIVGSRDITVTQGYSAGVLPIAHFGLGDLEMVDVRITPPGGADPIVLDAVPANQHLRWPEGCV